MEDVAEFAGENYIALEVLGLVVNLVLGGGAIFTICRRPDFELPLSEQPTRIPLYYAAACALMSAFYSVLQYIIFELDAKFAGFSRCFPWLALFVLLWNSPVTSRLRSKHDGFFRNQFFAHIWCITSIAVCCSLSTIDREAKKFQISFEELEATYDVFYEQPISSTEKQIEYVHAQVSYVLDIAMPFIIVVLSILALVLLSNETRRGRRVILAMFAIAVFQSLTALTVIVALTASDPTKSTGSWAQFYVDTTSPVLNWFVFCVLIAVDACRGRRRVAQDVVIVVQIPTPTLNYRPDDSQKTSLSAPEADVETKKQLDDDAQNLYDPLHGRELGTEPNSTVDSVVIPDNDNDLNPQRQNPVNRRASSQICLSTPRNELTMKVESL